ncbi:MAG: hypothetical protein LW645_12685 [Verrucomicrobiaceae bacterium]|jgi:hypothetical protein|nr:hypothetical protein [Verrucomicrobiaceae bacterium]
MRRPWIKVEVSTPDKPEICAIASRLRLDEDAVVGKLIRLWSWAELNRVNPNELNVTKEFLDKLVSKKGFSEAMILSGWLGMEGERLFFPNFGKHNGEESKVRGLTAKRVEKHRKIKASKNDQSVTQKVEQLPKAVPKPEMTNDVNNVQSQSKALSVSELPESEPVATEEIIETPPELPATGPIEILEPEKLAPEEVTETPKKRKAKPENSSDDQPMLF